VSRMRLVLGITKNQWIQPQLARLARAAMTMGTTVTTYTTMSGSNCKTDICWQCN
jgi:hypothetical protein